MGNSSPKENRKLAQNIHYRRVNKHPILTPQEERRLAIKVARNDLNALHYLVQSNMRYVVSIAVKFQRRGVPLEDLISEGYVGLIQAIKRFDPQRGTRLITYATWWIVKAMTNVIQGERIIRIPPHLLRKVARFCIEQEELSRENENHDPDEFIAQRLKMSKQKIRQMLQLPLAALSLDCSVSDPVSQRISERITDSRYHSPERVAVDNSLGNVLKNALSILDKRAAYVLQRRFGLNGNNPATLEEIGKSMKRTKECVRKIEINAISRLKRSRYRFDLEAYLSKTGMPLKKPLTKLKSDSIRRWA